MSSNILYLSQARVRETRMIPLDDLIRDFRILARQFPISAKPTDDWSQVLAHARDILKSLPATANRDLYWHGANNRACPCSSCCAAAYRLIGPNIEDALRMTNASKRRRSAA